MPIEKPLTDGIDLSVLLPAQSELRTGPHFSGPIARLCVAVLEVAVRDGRSSKTKIRADVSEWIEDTATNPFSLSWISDLLGLDACDMRAQMRTAINSPGCVRRRR